MAPKNSGQNPAKQDFAQQVASAKINLTLSVTGRTKEGYHQLVSAVGFSEFGDTLTITNAPDDGVRLIGPFAPMLQDVGGDTLLAKAKALAQQAASRFGYEALLSHHITLEKQIPLGGGLGGGSADAAAYLRFISQNWSQEARLYLRAQSVSLGADVPACFENRAHIMTGIGEGAITGKALGAKAPYMVIANPQIHADTGAVFGQFAAMNKGFTVINPNDIAAALSAHDWPAILAIGNDLTPAACQLYPVIASLLDEMAEAGAMIGTDFIGHAMSGSGASCFAFLHDEAAALAYQKRLSDKGIWAVATRFF